MTFRSWFFTEMPYPYLPPDDEFDSMRAELSASVETLSEVTHWILTNGLADPVEALSGATPYLRISGLVRGPKHHYLVILLCLFKLVGGPLFFPGADPAGECVVCSYRSRFTPLLGLGAKTLQERPLLRDLLMNVGLLLRGTQPRKGLLLQHAGPVQPIVN